MATIESLPPDQRAVLQLVLQQGRSYDQIAAMLSIDRGAVRDRALQSFDALGPETRVQPARRALITDYLLGQLPPIVAGQVYDRLGTSPAERAWARIMSSEIAPLARSPLPGLPSASAGRSRSTTAPVASPETPPREAAPPHEVTPPPVEAPVEVAPIVDDGYGRPDAESEGPPSSRRGGWIVIGAIAVAVVVIVVAIIAASGGTSNHSSSTAVTTDTPTTASTPTTATSTTTAGKTATKKVAQFALTAPGGAKSPTGEAVVLKQGTQEGIEIVGSDVAANTKKNAYAVWLSGGGKSVLLGFLRTPVSKNGKLATAGLLPANAARYTKVLVTLETQEKPTSPGKIVLQGALTTK